MNTFLLFFICVMLFWIFIILCEVNGRLKKLLEENERDKLVKVATNIQNIIAVFVERVYDLPQVTKDLSERARKSQ